MKKTKKHFKFIIFLPFFIFAIFFSIRIFRNVETTKVVKKDLKEVYALKYDTKLQTGHRSTRHITWSDNQLIYNIDVMPGFGESKRIECNTNDSFYHHFYNLVIEESTFKKPTYNVDWAQETDFKLSLGDKTYFNLLYIHSDYDIGKTKLGFCYPDLDCSLKNISERTSADFAIFVVDSQIKEFMEVIASFDGNNCNVF
ncbi:hypothetical protein ACFL13_02540 [Patescibacteria group bacterium]